ncbi:MAG: hypothetical protein IID15_07840 [Candidatus Marinimicrobia bacterium]|nr:hypothetical protein [Candidatus Neomarinimicrobiota bacterium]
MIAATAQVDSEKGRVARLALAAMDRLMPLWDRLMILEPERWIIAITLVAAGQAAVHSSRQEELFWHLSYNFGTLGHYLAVCLLMAAGALKRQLSRRDKPLDTGPGNRLSELKSDGKMLAMIAWGLLGLGLIGIALSGPVAVLAGAALFLISGGIEGITATRNSPVKPLRMLEYSGMALLLLLLGWELADGRYGAAWGMLAPYMAAATAAIILLVMEPFEPASEAAVVNARSTYGWVLLMVATALIVLAIFTGYANRDPVISTAAMISLPFYIIAALYRRPGDLSRGIRYSMMILIIFTGARYPHIYLPILALFYVARFYFARRYDLAFPAFAPESAD